MSAELGTYTEARGFELFEALHSSLTSSNDTQNPAVFPGSSYVKLFGKAQVDMNLSLGQFVKVMARSVIFTFNLKVHHLIRILLFRAV